MSSLPTVQYSPSSAQEQELIHQLQQPEALHPHKHQPFNMERSVSPFSASPMHKSRSNSNSKNVQFTESSPIVHKYNENAIVSSDENDGDDESDLVPEKQHLQHRSGEEIDSVRSNLQNYHMTPEGSTISENPPTTSSSEESLFNKRPLSDTPILSANPSPSGTQALSPMVLSEDELDDEDDKEHKTSEQIKIEKQTESNTKQNQTIPVITEPPTSPEAAEIPLPKYRTTLDIPGQTASKQSPDGSIRNTSERVVIVMIGLPARGKSFLSNKLVRYLNWLQIKARIFNVGSTRRAKAADIGPESSPLPDNSISKGSTPIGSNTPTNGESRSDSTDGGTVHDANFFSPDNKASIALREQWAKETLENLLDYLLKGDGAVGVFDATNSTIARRKWVLNTIRKRSKGELKILFLESICNDKNIIEDNIHLKLQGPDYKNMSPDLALKDFVGRLHNYEKAYETISPQEEMHKDFQYIQMIDVGRKMITCNIKGFLASQIIYYFLNFNLQDRLFFLTRHGESVDNVAGRIGGDSPLTKRGHKFGKALAKFMEFKKVEFRKRQLAEFEDKLKLKHYEFRDKTPPDEPTFSVFSSMLQRCVQTSEYFSETEYDVKQMRMLDELGAGKFDSMTYQEIQERNPDEFIARVNDKMSYRYPGVGGESYLDVINRLKPVITELERTSNHVLLITHRVVARVLLAYFMNLKRESIGELDVPLHVVYMFEPKPFGVDWNLYEFDEKTEWFNEIKPEELENSRKVKQVGVTFRERKYSVVPTAPKRHSSTTHGSSHIAQVRASLLGTIDSPPDSGTGTPLGVSGHHYSAPSGSTARFPLSTRTVYDNIHRVRGIPPPGRGLRNNRGFPFKNMATPFVTEDIVSETGNSIKDTELAGILDQKLASLAPSSDATKKN